MICLSVNRPVAKSPVMSSEVLKARSAAEDAAENCEAIVNTFEKGER
jgi:hypothetical protein